MGYTFPEVYLPLRLPEGIKVDTYFGQPFNGYLHPGLDVNGRHGGDTDCNAPIYAICKGIVEAIGEFPYWGSNVLVKHDFGPFKIWSNYCHLSAISVNKGQEVDHNTILGPLGKGDWQYCHLHFELRRRPLEIDFYNRDMLKHKNFLKDYYIDPILFYAEYGQRVNFVKLK